MTAWPCDAARPDVSNLNFVAGATTPNLATVALGAAGNFCLFASAATNVIVDVSAWYGAGDNRAASVVPSRIADTRTAKQKLAAGQVLVVKPTAAPDVPPTGVHAVALNVTATEPEKAGYLTVYPCDQPQPVASNVNYVAGHDTADAAIVGVSATDGSVCVFSLAATHVVVDVNGWFGPLGLARFTAQTPQRLFDTRDERDGAGQRRADGDAAQRAGRCRRAERHGHRRPRARLRDRLSVRHDARWHRTSTSAPATSWPTPRWCRWAPAGRCACSPRPPRIWSSISTAPSSPPTARRRRRCRARPCQPSSGASRRSASRTPPSIPTASAIRRTASHGRATTAPTRARASTCTARRGPIRQARSCTTARGS